MVEICDAVFVDIQALIRGFETNGKRVKDEVQRRKLHCTCCSEKRGDKLSFTKPPGHEEFHVSLASTKLVSSCSIQECQLDLPRSPRTVEQNFSSSSSSSSKLEFHDSQKMKQTGTKKKKRSRAAKTPVNYSSRDMPRQQDQQHYDEEQKKLLNSLMEAFGSISIEEATSAYNQANGDLNKAAEIPSHLISNNNECKHPNPSTYIQFGSISLEEATSAYDQANGDLNKTAEILSETGCTQNLNSWRGRCKGGKQQKRVVAATGTVSTVLGKEYIRASHRRDSAAVATAKSVWVKEEAEQFLFSMLGGECELSMAVVRDFLCQCGYNVEKTLDALLDLSASSYEQSKKCNDNVNNRQDTGFLIECADNLTDRASDSMSNSSESELQDSIWSVSYGCRTYSKVLASSEAMIPSFPRSNLSNLPQEVLDSLFNIPKSSEQEPSTMNWRNVVMKMRSLGSAIDVCPSSDAEPQQDIYAKGDEYHEFRKRAKEHWDSTRSYYHKATTAYSKGEWEYAAYLSDQGKIQTKLAREADERASQDIFKARNKAFENVITIDLHGQNVKQAMRLLKLHLLFGTHVPSVQTLRVITGCGKHGMGKSKLKQSVIKLLEKEGIQWHEENRGTVVVKLDGYKEFNFLDFDSDTE
ncbi:hypothetical protein REPUB_Repub05bG0163200 [Reevesia pubescens]